jgi:hypothetical protein
MIGYPSNVLVVADYPPPRFEEQFRKKVDFVLSCSDVEFSILEEIHSRFNKPIFAVKGNHDTSKSFPGFVQNAHLQLVQHRHWLIGGFGGGSAFKGPRPSAGGTSCRGRTPRALSRARDGGCNSLPG